MQNRKEKTIMNKGMISSLSLLMCGVLLSTSLLPTATAFAETTVPTTDSSTPVPTDDMLDTGLTDTSKASESPTPTVPNTESTTEDTTEPAQETVVEKSETDTTSESTTDSSTVTSEEVQSLQDTQRVPQPRSVFANIWGTSPVSFDKYTGILTVSAGTIGKEVYGQTTIGSIKKNDISEIIFQDNVRAPENSSSLFADSAFPNLTSIKGSLDTSNVTNMSNMFFYSKAGTLDVSNWDTSKVTNMSSMFSQSQATTLDVSNWDTSNVTYMSYMFSNSQATTLDVSNWDTSKVTDMRGIFGYSQATTLNVSNWDTSSVTNMSSMFYQSPATTLDISNWDTSKVTDMNGMFYQSQATTLDVSHWDTSKVTDMSDMFSQSTATTLDVSHWDTSKVTNMSRMFYQSPATTLDVSSWDTSKVTNMRHMFSQSQATTLDVSSWDTSKVTDMSYMFSNSQATTLDVSNWNTSKVTSMDEMFSNSKFNTLTLGQYSKFEKTVNLPMTDASTGEYTGKWERISPKIPISEYDSSDDFMDKYDGSQPGTYVWQKVKVPAKNLTVYYQDTEGNEISKPKTVSGNVGDKFNEAPLDIKEYTFKEVKDNAPTEGTLSDKEQSITFIYAKNSVKAKGLTVYYQNTKGNEISKSKIVSGNVGDKFNEAPLDIEGYTFKEVKDNTPTEGTLSDKEQSITFIYAKNTTEPTKESNEKPTVTGKTGSSNHRKYSKLLPKTGENVSLIVTLSGVTTLLLALCIWLFRRKQSNQ